MDGVLFANVMEEQRAIRGITKAQLYEALGVTATAAYGWRRGATPKREVIERAEEYFKIDLSKFENTLGREESVELRDILRERQDLRVLLNSAKDVPPSSVYALISELEKLKEGAD